MQNNAGKFYLEKDTEDLKDCFVRDSIVYKNSFIDGLYILWLSVSLPFALASFDWLSFWSIFLLALAMVFIGKLPETVNTIANHWLQLGSFFFRRLHAFWVGGILYGSGVAIGSGIFWMIVAISLLFSYLSTKDFL